MVNNIQNLPVPNLQAHLAPQSQTNQNFLQNYSQLSAVSQNQSIHSTNLKNNFGSGLKNKGGIGMSIDPRFMARSLNCLDQKGLVYYCKNENQKKSEEEEESPQEKDYRELINTFKLYKGNIFYFEE